MKILVFDPWHCLSIALACEAQERFDIDLEMADDTALAAHPGMDVTGYDALVVPPLAHLDTLTADQIEAHAEQVEALITPCREANTVLVWCVSDEIYEYGHAKGAIEESLVPVPESPSRKRLVDVGNRIRSELSCYLVVRVGPLFGLTGKDAWLPTILDGLYTGHNIAAEDDLYVGPTPVDALANGLCGMLLQLDNGANAYGPYHLSGIDPVSVYIFVASVRTCLAHELERRGIDDIQLGEVTPSSHRLGMVRRVMNCRHMLGTFGVHQKPWRLEIERLINKWLELRMEQAE